MASKEGVDIARGAVLAVREGNGAVERGISSHWTRLGWCTATRTVVTRRTGRTGLITF